MTNNPVKKSKTPFFHASRPAIFLIVVFSIGALYIIAVLFGAWLFNKFLRRFHVKAWVRACIIPLFLAVMFALPFYGHIMGKVQLAYYKDKYPPMSEVYKTVHSDSYVVIYEGNTFSSVGYPTNFNKDAYIYISTPATKEEYYYTKKDGKTIDTTDVLSKSRYHIYLTSEQITDRLEVREQRIVDATTGELLGRYRDLKVRLGTDYLSARGGDDYQLYPSPNYIARFNQEVILPLAAKEENHESTTP